jgi:hypothetical protein
MQSTRQLRACHARWNALSLDGVRLMASRDEDRFRVRPGPPKARSGPRLQRFVSQVLKQLSRAGANASGARGARSDSTFGRGRVAASMVGRALGPQARRVVIKSRFVVLKKAGANAVSTHLRYTVRDGVTREGEPGRAYGPDADTADLKAFEERGKGDRHQFRFIVSVEDAEQLEDLRSYTRSLLQRMSIDLETRLDWVAVDHWDTDNAHTHVVLRGDCWIDRRRHSALSHARCRTHGLADDGYCWCGRILYWRIHKQPDLEAHLAKGAASRWIRDVRHRVAHSALHPAPPPLKSRLRKKAPARA